MKLLVKNKNDRKKSNYTSKLYELIILFKQDINANAMHQDIVSMMNFIKANFKENKLIKSEYWGLRPLSYNIKNNKKAHFYYFVLSLNPEVLNKLREHIKINENAIRYLLLLSENDEEFHKKDSILMKNLKSDIEKEMGELQWNESFICKIIV